MPAIFFKSVPFVKEDVTLALESGVDGIVTEAGEVAGVGHLARCEVVDAASMPAVALESKGDEQTVAARLRAGEDLALARGWEVIPVENLLALPDVADRLAVEAGSLAEARLAAGILERGVARIVLTADALPEIKRIVAELKVAQGTLDLNRAKVLEVRPVGLGHRVCIDTLSLLQRGQGMLLGNSSAFTFLVHAETEHNEYVASRPFRVNAGGVHSYLVRPGDRTSYAGEVEAGDSMLVVDARGNTSLAIVGRVKTEVRPMLYIRAEADLNGEIRSGGIFLQNAETIRVVRPDGSPLSVVDLRPGDEILCRLDDAGRHFGMRIEESIQEG